MDLSIDIACPYKRIKALNLFLEFISGDEHLAP